MQLTKIEDGWCASQAPQSPSHFVKTSSEPASTHVATRHAATSCVTRVGLPVRRWAERHESGRETPCGDPHKLHGDLLQAA